MNAEELLHLWLDAHGTQHPMTPEMQTQFLARAEVERILVFPDSDIRRCVVLARKLSEILQCLEQGDWTAEATGGQPESAVARDRTGPARTSMGSRVPAAKPSTPSSGRSRQSGSVWEPPVNPDEAKQATVDFDRQHRQYP